MQKLERINDGYFGTGDETYSSDFFKVHVCSVDSIPFTTITCKALPGFKNKINFEGDCGFMSDSDCLSQYDAIEVLEMIEYSRNRGVNEGRKQKINEIKKFYKDWVKG
jgi:hypothetical protein